MVFDSRNGFQLDDNEIPDLPLITMPSASTRLTVTFLYSFPAIVLKSSASAIDAKHTIRIAKVVAPNFTRRILPLLRSTRQ